MSQLTRFSLLILAVFITLLIIKCDMATSASSGIQDRAPAGTVVAA